MGRFNWSIKENGGSELSAGTSDSTNFNISCNFPSNTTSSNKTYSVNVKDTVTSTEKSIDYVIIPCPKCYTITNNGDGSCEGGSIQFTATETPC